MSMREQIARALMGIKAYHGSPYDFDKFDLRKIGTGEGGQAYGHGLYFAEHEPVALSYKNMPKVTDMDWPVAGTEFKVPAWVARSAQTKMGLEDVLQNFRGRVIENKAALEAGDHNAASRVYNTQHIVDALEAVKMGAELKKPGHMYEVNINAEPSKMLDWFKPMGQQRPLMDSFIDRFGSHDDLRKAAAHSETLAERALAEPGNAALSDEFMAHYRSPQSKLGDLLINMDKPVSTHGYDAASKVTGERFYNALSPQPWDASKVLREGGVPGIKYRDAGSRTAAGSGTDNYVMFDDSLIDITRKYGLPLAAGATGFGAVADPSQYGAVQ